MAGNQERRTRRIRAGAGRISWAPRLRARSTALIFWPAWRPIAIRGSRCEPWMQPGGQAGRPAVIIISFGICFIRARLINGSRVNKLKAMKRKPPSGLGRYGVPRVLIPGGALPPRQPRPVPIHGERQRPAPYRPPPSFCDFSGGGFGGATSGGASSSTAPATPVVLSLIHISEPTRPY